jgi:hypothetical protein
MWFKDKEYLVKNTASKLRQIWESTLQKSSNLKNIPHRKFYGRATDGQAVSRLVSHLLGSILGQFKSRFVRKTT